MSDADAKVLQLERELREAREQQRASAEVLRVISASSREVQPAFDAIVRAGARLFEAASVALRLVRDGKVVRVATALGGGWPQWQDEDFREVPLGESRLSGRAVLRREMVVIVDTEGPDINPDLRESARRRGFRSAVAAPILRRGEAIGTIVVLRRTPGDFTEAQRALLRTFADQAVIAIENASLLQQLGEWNRTLEARVAEGIAELERAARLKRFLTPQIADLVLSGGGDELLRHHRREIVVVFLDLRGFTAFTETADPEEVMNVLAEYYERMGRYIAVHGGTLDKYTGDGIMVFFNDPIPVPDPAQRAARMALDMQDDFVAVAAGWKARGYELRLGIGIAQGYATLGTIGYEGRWDYGAIGTVCNLASRLCGEAQGGEILVSQRVLNSLGAQFDVEAAGDLVLKGFHRPVSAFRLRCARATT